MKKEVTFKKNFIWNSIGTGINAFNSLFLMIIVTRLNGVDDAGIFSIAFATACIFYVLGTYAGRIFQVTEADKEITDKDYILNRAISVLIMMICTIVFTFIRGYNLYKSVIFILMGIFKALEAFSDVLYGVLQKNDVLYKVGQSYFIKAVGTLIVFLVFDFITRNIIIASIAIIIVWIIVMICYDIPKTRAYLGRNIKPNFNNACKIFKTGFFIFAVTFLSMYIINAPKYAIDTYLVSSMQTIFGIIVMPATAISLFGQFILHPFLTNMLKLYQENKIADLKKIIRKIMMYTFLVGIISAITAYFVGIPVLNLIYGINLNDYKIHLIVIIIAATMYNMGGTYFSILTTIRETFIQFIIYLAISLLAIITSNIFTKLYGIYGATMAYFILMFTYTITYTIAANIILSKRMVKGG